jgi:transcriptional regulator with XRE-family HTH domain
VKKNWIDDAFREALNHCVGASKYGIQRKLADYLNVTPAYIYQLINGLSYGSEIHRRQLAEYFGYPTYDSFLKFGRSLLGGETAEMEIEAVSPAIRHLFSRLRRLDEPGIKAVNSLLDALEVRGEAKSPALSKNLMAERTGNSDVREDGGAGALPSWLEEIIPALRGLSIREQALLLSFLYVLKQH